MIREMTQLSANDATALTNLCLRSKAAHGYDATFMAACRKALTITPADAVSDDLAVVCAETGTFVAMAQVSVSGKDAELERLFVDPSVFRQGHGALLFNWSMARAVGRGAKRLWIVADPGAVAFYKSMGSIECGSVASDAVPGRSLPRLCRDL